MGKVNYNRPVHLAMRDKNYEQALGLLKYTFDGKSYASRKKIIYSLAVNLDQAYREARFALRGIVADQLELDFVKFLKMVLESVRAVKHMIDHEGVMRQDTSFLKRFLKDSPELLRDFKHEHRARAGNTLRALKVMVRATEKTFLEMKEFDRTTFNKDERRRYTAMYKS